MDKRLVSNLDIISDLPDDIIEEILMHLPFKEAVRTTVLSSKWRNRWASIPELVFSKENFDYKTKKLVKIVNGVLLSHRGPIRKFELSIKTMHNRSSINFLMKSLSRFDIKNIKIEFLGSEPWYYTVPSSLFSSGALYSLDLESCALELPPTFNGLRNLRFLCLRDVYVLDAEIFENIIFNCPFLEELSLSLSETELTGLRVDSPYLRYFYYNGPFIDICFKDASHLTDVTIDFEGLSLPSYKRDSVTPHLIDALGCLTSIESLEFQGRSLKLLAMMFQLQRCFQLPISYHHLSNLTLLVNFKDLNEIKITTFLLKNSPNLQHLEIFADIFDKNVTALVEDCWEAQELDCSMNHLNMVRICAPRTRTELQFIKFILANSPLLEVLCIIPHKTNQNIKIAKLIARLMLKKIRTFQRASTNAKIDYIQRSP